MLSSHEQRIWDDIERFYAAEAPEPVLPGRHAASWHRRVGRGVDDLPAAVVGGAWAMVLLVVFGAVVAGLAVGAATALGWLLWRSRPLLRRGDPTSAGPDDRAD
ncbi:hypothetical protein ACI78V_20515 [Geodermatophilus sp. SYSU D00742]